MEITKEEYLQAIKIINAYEKQLVIVKTPKKYLMSNDCKYFSRNAVAYWACDEAGIQIPEIKPDAMIVDNSDMGFYSIVDRRLTYKTFNEAYNSMVKDLKRKNILVKTS